MLCKNDSLGSLSFGHYAYTSVTQAYDSSNILRFKSLVLNEDNFSECSFLVVMNASATTGRSSIWHINFIAGHNATKLSIDMADNAPYPRVQFTSVGNAFISWSSTATANIFVNLFKMHNN